MVKGKLVQAERVRQGAMTDWAKEPVFELKPEGFQKAVRDGNVILVTGMPEIVDNGIFNKSTNKFKLNFKQSAIQTAVESGIYCLVAKMQLNFAASALTADTAYSILGSMLYITKLSADNKVYLCMADGTTVAKKEITLASGMTVTAIFSALEVGSAPKMAVGLVDASSEYATNFGTKADYDTTPSTIAFTTAGTTTEMFNSNALNICLQHLCLFDYNPQGFELKAALEG